MNNFIIILDGDESSCGGLTYDITEPCDDDLYCLRKYLNVSLINLINN